jgi:hypothetical protein
MEKDGGRGGLSIDLLSLTMTILFGSFARMALYIAI